MTDDEKRVHRLLWRAGFGARREEIAERARAGVDATVDALLNPEGEGVDGPGPPLVDGEELDPVGTYGHPQLWWLDRAVRTRHPLLERMTLNWHDHFATRQDEVPSPQLMLDQYATLQAGALGAFRDLARAIAMDGAMQHFLSIVNSSKEEPNENFARELFELFTLGANNGYTEADVRDAARAFTGYTYDFESQQFGWDGTAHDRGRKTVLGRRGPFTPIEIVDAAIDDPRHPEFICTKLWAYHSPRPVSARLLDDLTGVYRDSDTRIAPVLRRILTSDEFYADLDAPDMIKPPFVFVAGMLRLSGGSADDPGLVARLDRMGQLPFYPPNVSGWGSGTDWLSSNALRERFDIARRAFEGSLIDGDIPAESADAALARARGAVGDPWTSTETDAVLADYAESLLAGRTESLPHYYAERQRVLMHLLLTGPDAQVC